MPATNERLTALLDMSLMEIRIMYNNMPPGKFKWDTQERIKELIRKIHAAKYGSPINSLKTKHYERTTHTANKKD